MWNNSFRTPSGCWQKMPAFQKGKLISTKWSRAKDTGKMKDKGLGMGTWTSGREPWRRESLHTQKPPHGWGQKHLQNLKGEHSNIRKPKWKRFTTEITADQHFPVEMLFACPLQWFGAECWDSGFRHWTPGTKLGLTAMMLIWGKEYNTAEQVQGKAWAFRRVKGSLLQGKLPHMHRLQDSDFVRAIDGRSHRCGLPPQRQVHWPPLPKLAKVPGAALATTAVYGPRPGNAGWLATSKAKARARDCWQNATVVPTPEAAAFTKQWAGTGNWPHLSGNLCSLALLRDEPRPTPLRKHIWSDYSNFLQASTSVSTPTCPSCVCCITPSPKSNWASEPWSAATLVHSSG